MELNTKKLYQLVCERTDDGHMLSHQDTNVLINSINVVTNVYYMFSNIDISAYSM